MAAIAATIDFGLASRMPAKWFGTVEATDADAAIAAAVKLFDVKDSRKLIAMPR